MQPRAARVSASHETNHAEKETIPPSARHCADTIGADKARANKGFGAMATARYPESIDSGDRELSVRLRPADNHAPRTASQIAGPFEIAAEERASSTMRDALMTGLLVIYPAFAALAAIVAGLFLTGASGT